MENNKDNNKLMNLDNAEIISLGKVTTLTLGGSYQGNEERNRPKTSLAQH